MKSIRAQDYITKNIGHGMFKIFLAIGTAHAIEEVKLDYWFNGDTFRFGFIDEYGHPILGGFGNSIEEIEGSVLLSDGRVLTCVTSKEGGDTFQSGQLETNYYILTPKLEK